MNLALLTLRTMGEMVYSMTDLRQETDCSRACAKEKEPLPIEYKSEKR